MVHRSVGIFLKFTAYLALLLAGILALITVPFIILTHPTAAMIMYSLAGIMAVTILYRLGTQK